MSAEPMSSFIFLCHFGLTADFQVSLLVSDLLSLSLKFQSFRSAGLHAAFVFKRSGFFLLDPKLSGHSHCAAAGRQN